MRGLRGVWERHGVWLLASAVVTIAGAVATGWWLITAYSAANAIGSVLYLDGVAPGRASTRRRWWPLLTVALLPVGLLSLLLGRRRRPIDVVYDEDERLRREVGRVSSPPPSHGGLAPPG